MNRDHSPRIDARPPLPTSQAIQDVRDEIRQMGWTMAANIATSASSPPP
jgi:hypothetical protein